MTITVIGAGEVGSSVIALLASEFTSIRINAIDPSDQISGKILDLQHAAKINDNILQLNNKEWISDSEIIVYSAGYCNAVGQDRNTVSQDNKQLVESIFSDLSLNENTLIIVITNPVEPVTAWISNHVKTNKVIGTGTYLDTIRLQWILSENEHQLKLNSDPIVLGEHGTHMVALLDNNIDDKDCDKIDIEIVKESIRNELKLSAASIRKTEKATKYGVSACALNLIKQYLSNQLCTYPVSVRMTPEWRNYLGIEETSSCFLSLPTLVGKENISVVSPDQFKLSQKEKQQLLAAFQSINSII